MKTPLRHFPMASSPASADRSPSQRCQGARSIAGKVGRGVLTAPGVKTTVFHSGLLLFALLVALVAIPVRLVPAAEGANELLQKGLFEEEANHNLDAAIKAYQSVITQQDDQRKLSATAVFRLGECYRKLGRTNEATAQYERILRDFADQPSLAALSRQYVGQTSSESSASMLGSQDRRLMESKRIELQSDYDRLRTFAAPLKAMRRDQLKKVIPTVAPDQLLEKLLEQLATAEQKVAELSDNFGPDHPDVKRARAVLKAIQAQIDERLDAILAGLNVRVEVAKAALDDFTQEWKKGREEASAPPAAAELTDAEEKELREIKAIIKDSPDLINAARIQPWGTRLLNAAAAGQVRVAEFLLDNKADVNAKQSGGYSALHLAADFGHKTMVELLLRHGAEVNAKENGGATPLHHAAYKGFKSVVEVLLGNGADVNANGSAQIVSVGHQTTGTPLHLVAESGFTSVAELLLAKGADVNARSNQGRTPLHLAAAKGDYRLADVASLLRSRAEVNARNSYGATPLVVALAGDDKKECVKVVEQLLAKAADVNARDENGSFPLYLAVQRRSEELVRLILAHKPDLEIPTREGGRSPAVDYTPLQKAVSLGEAAIAALLLESGANPNVLGTQYGQYYEQTPLLWAVQNVHKKMVEVLLAAKANVNVVDTSGNTPLHWAELYLGSSQPNLDQKSTLAEIVKLLKQAGAQEDFHLRSSINVSRKERGLSRSWFFKGTNSINRFSLFELIADFYKDTRQADQQAYSFTDFAKVTIKRLPAKRGAPKEIDVDLEAAFRTGDCSKDLWLEWGDIVEIPERDHTIAEGWEGLTSQATEMLRKCLEKKVKIAVKGETTEVTLRPDFITPRRSSLELGRRLSEGIVLSAFRLDSVVHNCGLLRAFSDLAHVKVNHHDPVSGQSQELLFDLSARQAHDSRNDLWLRDGDVIEIPEK